MYGLHMIFYVKSLTYQHQGCNNMENVCVFYFSFMQITFQQVYLRVIKGFPFLCKPLPFITADITYSRYPIMLWDERSAHPILIVWS